jgi:hypothetical protein
VKGEKLATNNLETWRRLTRLELQPLCGEIGNAAMAMINEWPRSGEGRAVKAGCERISVVLEHTTRTSLASAFTSFDEVMQELRLIEANSFFQSHLASRKLRGGRWPGRELGEVLQQTIEKTSQVLTEHGPAVRRAQLEKSARSRSQKAVSTLSGITPAQRQGPAQFVFLEGVLHVANRHATPGAKDAKAAEQARVQLIADAKWLIENLRQANIDQRVVEIIDDMRDQLSSSQNIIRVGIVNVACDQIVNVVAEEISGPIVARFKAFSVGVNLWVSQFPEWHSFVDNSAKHDANIGDAKTTLSVGRQLAKELRSSGLADPEVPRTIELVLEALTTPERAGQRAVFAAVRTIENVIARVFTEFGGILGAVPAGVREGVKQGTKITTAVVMLGIAATAATNIGPAAKHVLKTDWLKKAGEIVTEGLKGS